MTYHELVKAIESYGCHAELGPSGLHNWGIEQNPHELATFLTAVGSFHSILEIGTGYRAGLTRFLANVFAFQVTSVDIKNYGHDLHGATLIVLPPECPLWVSAQRFDVVLLDGPKEYYALKEAYEHYESYGKIVALHDIAGLRACQDVKRFWGEQSRYKNGRKKRGFHEVIADGPAAAGLGWCRRG